MHQSAEFSREFLICINILIDVYVTYESLPSKPSKQKIITVIRRVFMSVSEPLPHYPPEMHMEMVIDRAELLAVAEGDTDLIKELVELFLADYPRRMTQLQAAIASGNATALARGAHTLKGAVSNLAAHGASAAAHCLERLAGMEDLSQASAAYESLESEMKRLIPALTSITKEISS